MPEPATAELLTQALSSRGADGALRSKKQPDQLQTADGPFEAQSYRDLSGFRNPLSDIPPGAPFMAQSHRDMRGQDEPVKTLAPEEGSATLRVGQSSFETRSEHAQAAWPQTPLRDRLAVVRRFRALVADDPSRLTAAISPVLARTPADTLAAEVLPLLAACRFLEREAARILRPRPLGRSGRPLWLPGVSHRIDRVPLGRVLIIGPGNYPLFLPGVQALQALVAGNVVVWKPGEGGEPVAHAMAALLARAGLPPDTLAVTDESPGTAQQILAAGAPDSTGFPAAPAVDLVILTGSAETGRAVLRQAAETLTPVIAELSGCDSVLVLPDADLDRVVAALTFGMRLNGSATCMAPRRVVLVGATAARTQEFTHKIQTAFRAVPGIALPARSATLLCDLLDDAHHLGAQIHGEPSTSQQPVLIAARPGTLPRSARTDVFAPVLTLLSVADEAAAIALEADGPFALTCSIFGAPRRARSLALQLRCGTVLLNDIIVPTADPRVPFGGRKASGFGVTRGAEGLLSMTAPRVVTERLGRSTRHLQPTGLAHESLFHALCRALYSGGWRSRIAGARLLARAARNLSEGSGPRTPGTLKDPS